MSRNGTEKTSFVSVFAQWDTFWNCIIILQQNNVRKGESQPKPLAIGQIREEWNHCMSSFYFTCWRRCKVRTHKLICIHKLLARDTQDVAMRKMIKPPESFTKCCLLMFNPIKVHTDLYCILESGVHAATTKMIQKSILPPCYLSFHSAHEGMWGHSGEIIFLLLSHCGYIAPLCLQEKKMRGVLLQTHLKMCYSQL